MEHIVLRSDDFADLNSLEDIMHILAKWWS